MRETKHVFLNYAFYDRTWIQKYLEKQASKGWLLEKIETRGWRFRRIEPQKMHFTVTYFPKADMYDPEPSEQEQTFREFCAHGGWTLAASSAQMQIFYSEAMDPIPIETDPVMEVENIHKSMKKSMLPSYWILLVASVMQLAVQWINFQEDFIGYLSRNLSLFFAFSWIVLLILGINRLGCYHLWHRRAKAAAELDGSFLETRSASVVEAVVCALIVVGFTGVLATMENRQMAVVLGLMMILVVCMIFLIEGFRQTMKKDGYDARTNKISTFIACVVLSIVLIGFGTQFIAGGVQILWPDKKGEDVGLPLTIEDLQGEDNREYDTLVLTDQESVLLGYHRIYQVHEGNSTIPNMEYNLVKVKASFLYERCLEELMQLPAYMTEGEYRYIDPTPWGAEQAWQVYDGEELRQWYILCYESTILELIASWEMTEDQMEAVGAIFG